MKKVLLTFLTATTLVTTATTVMAQTNNFSYSINKNGNNKFTITTSNGDFSKLPSGIYMNGKYYTFTYNSNGNSQNGNGSADTELPDDNTNNGNSSDNGNNVETKPENGNDNNNESGNNNSGNNQNNSGNGQSGTVAISNYEKEVLNLVNKERAKYGISALKLDSNVQKAAKIRAGEIKTVFSHTRPNGTKFSTALTQTGAIFKGAGENIASGQKSPEEVVKAWMNSEGHRANILNEKYKYIGIGCERKGNSYTWVQIFTY